MQCLQRKAGKFNHLELACACPEDALSALSDAGAAHQKSLVQRSASIGRNAESVRLQL